LIAVVGTLFLALTSQAQESQNHSSFIEASFHAGSNYYPGGELEDELDNGYEALYFRIGWQPYNYEGWAAIFNYANYGLGYWITNVGDSDIFGHPMALYGFINFPVYRSSKVEVMAGPALGFAFNIKPFDPVTNPQNDLTGGTIAAYFNPSLSAAFKLSEQVDLKVAGNFIHMPNGGLKQPNTGFDMYGANIGLRYHFNRKSQFTTVAYDEIFNEKRPKDKNKSSSINLFQAVGADQNAEGLGDYTSYFVSTTTLEYQYRFNEIHGMTAGINVFYDESTPLTQVYEQYNTKVFPGIHVGYDFHFWRMAIRQQFGYLLTEAGREIKAGFFMRLALSADITKTIYVQAAVKSIHGFKADWADFGVGVRLFKH